MPAAITKRIHWRNPHKPPVPIRVIGPNQKPIARTCEGPCGQFRTLKWYDLVGSKYDFGSDERDTVCRFCRRNERKGHPSEHRDAIRRATPTWADEAATERMYAAAREMTARTGIPHAVDHVVPLRGENVCGLHIHTNLQIIPVELNSMKKNKHTS